MGDGCAAGKPEGTALLGRMMIMRQRTDVTLFAGPVGVDNEEMMTACVLLIGKS